jgi:hypothetical protein
MAIAVKNNTVYAVEIETTEGEYLAPQADTSYVQVLADGAELTPAKELVERNIFNGSIGKSTPRTGTKSVTGSMPVEMRAAFTEGAAPEYDKLLRSALGSRRQASTTTVNDGDSGGTHTTTRAYLPNAAANKYSVGDSVTIKRAGAYHTSPVTAVSHTSGDVYIDILLPMASAFVDGDVIAALTTYTVANSGHPSLSISKYLEEAILEQATGCRVSSLALENFTTGQLASFNFGFEGLSFDRSITAQPHTPNFSDALPPIILNACVYQDGVDLQINSFDFSLENTLGFATSTCSSNGRISGRASERVISGTFNPYKYDDSIDQFTKFVANTEFSLFGSAHVPTSTAGEYNQVVAFYMPACIATELSESDQDGLLQEEVSFSASRGQSGESDELYITFS